MIVGPRTTLFYDRHTNINKAFVRFQDRKYKANEKCFFLYKSDTDTTIIAEKASFLLPLNIDDFVTNEFEEITIKIREDGFDIDYCCNPYSSGMKAFKIEPTFDNIEKGFIDMLG